MAAHDVVLVGSLDYYFNPVTEAVIAKGHNVVRYNMPADFAAKPDALDNASVLYAVGYCPVSREVMARALQASNRPASEPQRASWSSRVSCVARRPGFRSL